MRSEARTKYPPDNIWDASFRVKLSDDTKSGKLTLSMIKAALPLDKQEQKTLLESVIVRDGKIGTLISNSILGHRLDLFEYLIKEQQLNFSSKLFERLLSEEMDLKIKKQFFDLAISYIIEKLETIESLNDEIFNHIYELENFIVTSQYNPNHQEFYYDLLNTGELTNFRQHVVEILYNKGITYEDLYKTLVSAEESNDPDLVFVMEQEISDPKTGVTRTIPAANKIWQELFDKEARITEEEEMSYKTTNINTASKFAQNPLHKYQQPENNRGNETKPLQSESREQAQEAGGQGSFFNAIARFVTNLTDGRSTAINSDKKNR